MISPSEFPILLTTPRTRKIGLNVKLYIISYLKTSKFLFTFKSGRLANGSKLREHCDSHPARMISRRRRNEPCVRHKLPGKTFTRFYDTAEPPISCQG